MNENNSLRLIHYVKLQLKHAQAGEVVCTVLVCLMSMLMLKQLKHCSQLARKFGENSEKVCFKPRMTLRETHSYWY